MKRALIVPLLLLFLLSYSEASKEVSVQGLRYSSYKNHTRVVVDVDGPIKFSSNHLSNPDRLYFDLKDCLLPEKVKSLLLLNDGIIKTVRTSQYNNETVRIVLDIQKIKRFYAFTLEDPHRLVIDVYTGKSPAPAKKSMEKNGLSGIRRIVIDPGHGGKDPGAIGPGGLREKNIVLDVGKKLGRILKQKYGLEVVYTRKKDVFVPLNERTEIANLNKADLFISVHVNASRRRSARGIETYFLGSNSDEGSLRVAARENNISIDKMRRLRGGLQMILADLRRSYKMEESGIFARNVQDSMVNTLQKSYRRIKDLDVKKALFYVLIGAEMPSILVEVSFVSNREEEKRLSRSSYRNKIAESIARGVSDYIKQSRLIVSPFREFEADLISEGMIIRGNKTQKQG